LSLENFQRIHTISNYLTEKKEREIKQRTFFQELEGRSLFIFSTTNPFRLLCSKIVSHYTFDNIILLLIGVSTIFLALENPLNNPEGNLMKVLYYSDICLTTIFSFEALLKIVVYGILINGKHSYLKNGWNIMDFLVVGFSVRVLL